MNLLEGINLMRDESFEVLDTPLEVRTRKPLPLEVARGIEAFRSAIDRVLKNKDRQRLLIVGPCSLHDVAASLEFAARLKALSKEVEDEFLLVMRCHVEKPRTALGWKGMLFDPHLDGSLDIAHGIEKTRSLLLEIASLEVPIAAEFLDPLAALYYQDLVSFGVIGARTSLSPPHRQLASSLDMPVGFEKPLRRRFKKRCASTPRCEGRAPLLELRSRWAFSPDYLKG